jgi:hypothetical protein
LLWPLSPPWFEMTNILNGFGLVLFVLLLLLDSRPVCLLHRLKNLEAMTALTQ